MLILINILILLFIYFNSSMLSIFIICFAIDVYLIKCYIFEKGTIYLFFTFHIDHL